MLYYIIPYHIILYCIVLYCTLLSHVMLCYAMLCYDVLCYAVLCCAIHPNGPCSDATHQRPKNQKTKKPTPTWESQQPCQPDIRKEMLVFWFFGFSSPAGQPQPIALVPAQMQSTRNQKTKKPKNQLRPGNPNSLPAP